MVDGIKKNLTNIVVVIGLVGSIGAGFSKFAKMESTIEQLASKTTIDYSSQIAVLEEKVSALENGRFRFSPSETPLVEDETERRFYASY